MTRGWMTLALRYGVAATVMTAGAALIAPEAVAADATRPSTGNKPAKKPTPPKKKKNNKKKKNPGMGPFEKDEYPLAERARPLVLPDKMGEITVSPTITHAHLIDNVDYFTTGLDFEYGLADVVELGVGTGFMFAPDVDWTNELHVQVHWLAYDSKDFDFAPGVVVPFYFTDGAPFGANIDLTSRYVIDDQFFLTFGQGAIGLVASPDFGLSINGHGAFNWQVDKPIVLFLDTTVFSLLLAPDVDVTGLWETLNVGIGGQYTAARTVDVGARLSYVDTFKVEDEFTFAALLYGRFRF